MSTLTNKLVILSEVVDREAGDDAVEVEVFSGRMSPLPKSRAKSRELGPPFVLELR